MDVIVNLFLGLSVFGAVAVAIALQIKGRFLSMKKEDLVLGLGIIFTCISFMTVIEHQATDYTAPFGSFLLAIALLYKARGIYRGK